MDRERASCKSGTLKVVLVHLLLLAAIELKEARFLSAVKIEGQRLLLHNEVASADHSDATKRASDEPVTVRGLTDTPHAAIARHSQLQKMSPPPTPPPLGGSGFGSSSGYGSGRGVGSGSGYGAGANETGSGGSGYGTGSGSGYGSGASSGWKYGSGYGAGVQVTGSSRSTGYGQGSVYGCDSSSGYGCGSGGGGGASGSGAGTGPLQAKEPPIKIRHRS